MSDNISNCVPRDATDFVVSLNTEYMYTYDGLKLKVCEFGYSKDFGWCVYVMDDKPRCDKYNDSKRYKLSELYVNRPPKSNVQRAIDDLSDIKYKLGKLTFYLADEQDIYDALRDYAFDNLDLNKGDVIGWDASSVLRLILSHVRVDLFNIINKLNETEEN